MTATLTPAEQTALHETWEHIHRVRELLTFCINEMLSRSLLHDQSKLRSPELEGFAQCNGTLAGTTYGSEEYNARKKSTLLTALTSHYRHNRHHPEHFKEGIDEMNLIDVLEMFCDWMASSERHNDGNIRKSIEINGDRFDMSPQLIRLLENTADFFDR